ncbi:tail fiber assembly protein [Kluyvera intermedia]|uniref:tail fiber assembly protein n=1 Tax=Kluyvera intermedia TaxID=61648 RepID=UPI001F1DD3FB|nr:tail fiber assembly protein [Kluyvera intermedia]MCE9890752.1 tail fiber assembly protein [Kluyvera intermedia]
MTDLFDKNGNATETHIVTVSGFDSATGEFINTYDVRILAGTGIPRPSSLTQAPAADAGHAVCWDGAKWQQVIDLRGTTAYETATGDDVRIKTLGPLADGLTAVAPATPYDVWDGAKWVTDSAAAQEAAKAEAEFQRSLLLNTANAEITWRQDAVDVGEATEEETAALTAWKKYRVLLMRVDTAAPVWPTPPNQ